MQDLRNQHEHTAILDNPRAARACREIGELVGPLLEGLAALSTRLERIHTYRGQARGPELDVLERVAEQLAEAEERVEALDQILSHRAGSEAAAPRPRPATSIDEWVRAELEQVEREQRAAG